MQHTPYDCACTDGKHTLTIRSDAAKAYQGLCMHAWKHPVDYGYMVKLRALEGSVVAVTHIFRGPTGLPTGYSAGGLHLQPILVVEDEPVLA